jgi:lipopolysaccharide export system permease protein
LATLDRYIASTVFLAMALVLLVLGGLDLMFMLIDELIETDGGYDTAAALRFVLLKSPRYLYDVLPPAALIGALAGLGSLAASNELVGIQAAGWSRARISWAVLQPTVLVMLLGLLLGEFVAPRLELQAEVGKALANGETVGLSRFGHWERHNHTYVHFNALDADGALLEVEVFEYDEQQRLLRQTSARQAVFLGAETRSGEDARWRLRDGSQWDFSRTAAGLQAAPAAFSERDMALGLLPETLQILVIDPDRMAISALWQAANRFLAQGLDASRFQLGFWKKVLQPLNTLALVFVAISFIFGPLRSASMGSRVFSAVTLGLLATILQRLLQNLSLVYQLPALLAVLLPILLCLLAGALLLRRR